MEGIKFLLIFSLAAILFVSVGMADTNLIVNITDDTFAWLDVNVSADICNYGYNFNLSNETNYGENETILALYFKADSQPYNLKSYFKFNTSTAQNKIIKNVTMMSYKLYSSCGAGTTVKPISFLSNDTWNKSTLTGINAPAGENSFNILRILATGTLFKSDNLMNYSKFADDVYNDNSTTLVMGKEHAPFPGCAAAFNSVCIKSNELSSLGSWLNFTLVDYLSGNITANNAQDIYFDFETGTWNATAFYEADLYYDAKNNVLWPMYPTTISANPIYSDNLTNQSLAALACSVTSVNTFGGYSNSKKYPNERYYETPKIYDQWCFEQQGSHGGRNFYGAIKIVGYENGDFLACPLGDCKLVQFYWAMYAPTFTTFQLLNLVPDPPVANINLTITWTTTNETYGWITYRYNNSGNWTGWFSAFEDNVSAYGAGHSAVINGAHIVATNYQYYLNGNDTAGNNYTSDIGVFTAISQNITGTPFTNVTENTTVPGAIQDLVDSGFFPSLEMGTWAFGLIIVGVITGFLFWVGGLKLGFAGFVSSATACSVYGLLPIYVFIFLIVISGFVVVKLVKGGM